MRFGYLWNNLSMTAIISSGVVELIIKTREKPAKIAGYEALLKRLPAHHIKRGSIQDSLNSANAGFGGEERLDREMEFFDPPYAYLSLQGLSLPDRSQIDSVLITQSRIVLMEVKNISGPLRFTENPSSLQKILPSGEVKGYKSPVTQLKTAKIKVEKILKKHNIHLPIETAVVVAYPSQTIENVPSGIKVWNAEEVFVHLSTMEMAPELLTIEQMNFLGSHLLAMDEPFDPFPLAPRFQIEPGEIETGVYCPRCRLMKMERAKQTWQCHTCFISSTDAYYFALEEWFMLIKPTITTSECRDFLGLADLAAAKRMLKKHGLQETGGRRYRQYIPVKDKVF